jgi:pyruvate/2-oxoglutarate dehydrogenase complex dihydrolipoamide dehydrogenase (E3) component
MPETLNPEICVVGGGPAGIAAALAAAGEGVSVVLVEKGALGGANLASGAVPSKALLAAAEVYELLRRGPAIGVTGAPLQVNFPKVREHLAAVGAAVAANVTAERLTALGITVVNAAARFADRDTILAGDVTIRPRRVVLAVGSEPAPPDIPGLDGIDVMTVANALDLSRKLTHLIVLGAGREGLELAQAFNRLGVDTTVLDRGPALPDVDPELSAIVLDRLRAEGIRVRVGVGIVSIGRRRGGVRVTVADPEDDTAAIDGSHLLIASGRKPCVDGLDLANAGIRHDAAGIVVDRGLRTGNRRVYAIGDAIAGPVGAARGQFQAKQVVTSILFRLPLTDRSEEAPLVVFTDPALATVGLGEAGARRRHGASVRVLRFPFAENDRAQIERLPAGMIKVVVGPGGRVLGAGIVGHDAGEMIALWSLAVARRLPISALASLPVPYLTRAEISRRVAAGMAERDIHPGLTATWRRRIIRWLGKLG